MHWLYGVIGELTDIKPLTMPLRKYHTKSYQYLYRLENIDDKQDC